MAKVGRPVSKPNRVKVGLSLDPEVDRVLNELAVRSSKTKSKVFEEAIKYFKAREDIIAERMRDVLENGEDALLDFDKLIQERANKE